MTRSFLPLIALALCVLAACAPAAPAATATPPPPAATPTPAPTPTPDPNADWHRFSSDKFGVAFDYWCDLGALDQPLIRFTSGLLSFETSPNIGLGVSDFASRDSRSIEAASLKRDDDRLRSYNPPGVVLEATGKDGRVSYHAYYQRGATIFIIRALPAAALPACEGRPSALGLGGIFYRTAGSFAFLKP